MLLPLLLLLYRRPRSKTITPQSKRRGKEREDRADKHREKVLPHRQQRHQQEQPKKKTPSGDF